MKIVAAFACAILLGSLVYFGGAGGAVDAQGPSARLSADSAACTRLMSLTLPNAAVTSAQVVPAGQFTPPASAATEFADLPAFCRVVGTVLPELGFEVWLPAQWNHKYVGVGNGGLAGKIV